MIDVAAPTTKAVQRGLKRHIEENTNDDRPTQMHKLGPEPFSAIFVDRTAQEVKHRAECAAGRQLVVHEILSDQRPISASATMRYIERRHDYVAIPSFILESLPHRPLNPDDSTNVASPPQASSIASKDIEEHKPQVRRSGRKRKAVQYTEKFHQDPSVDTESLRAGRRSKQNTSRESSASITTSVRTVEGSPKAIFEKTAEDGDIRDIDERNRQDAVRALLQLAHLPHPTDPLKSTTLESQASEEHNFHEAALALLKLSWPAHATDPAESAMRESLSLIKEESQLMTDTKMLDPVPQAPIETRATVEKAKKGGRRPKPRIIDTEEFFMPSAENDFKFKYDSPSGLTAAQLDKLLMPPARPAISEWDADGLSKYGVGALSYVHTGTRPKKGFAEQLVAGMEIAYAKDVREREEEQDVKYQLQDTLMNQEHDDSREVDECQPGTFVH